MNKILTMMYESFMFNTFRSYDGCDIRTISNPYGSLYTTQIEYEDGYYKEYFFWNHDMAVDISKRILTEMEKHRL